MMCLLTCPCTQKKSKRRAMFFLIMMSSGASKKSETFVDSLRFVVRGVKIIAVIYDVFFPSRIIFLPHLFKVSLLIIIKDPKQRRDENLDS